MTLGGDALREEKERLIQEAKLKVSPRASTQRKKRKASAGVDRGRGT